MKNRYRIFILGVLILSAALACQFEGLPITPTTGALPTPTASTQEPQVKPFPTLTLLPSIHAQEYIFIESPGLGSKVTSPATVEGFSGPTFEQTLAVSITDIDGTVLAMEPANIQADIGVGGAFSVTLEFTVDKDKPGRISVYDISARDGGIVHLDSAPVTLLATGSAEIVPSEPGAETIRIASPTFLEEVSGGVLEVSGYSEYFFEVNLSVTICGSWTGGDLHFICGTSDNVIAEGYATIESPDMGIPGPFSGSLAYNALPDTRARVVVFAASPMDGGIEHLSSVEVVLNP
ncbi:MAG: Gmad2 immunoglobulin-like domain-containing protein [Anaerolineales bacterium]|jgi:hypothetical protein